MTMIKSPPRAVLVCLASLLTLVSCSSGNSADKRAAGDVDVAAAKAGIAPFMKSPTGLKFDADKLAELPVGATIYEMEGPAQISKVVGDAAEAACDQLGCELVRVPTGATPGSIVAAWQRAVRDKPDAVVAAGVAKALVGSQIEQLRDAGVKVVTMVSDALVGTDVDASLAGPERFALDGKLQADWIVADAGKPVDVVYYDYPDLPFLSSLTNGFTDEMKRVCAGCNVSVQHYTLAQATTFPSRLVGYLRQHPEISYVGLSDGDEMAGVQQALTVAGLADKVKFVTRAGSNLNFEMILDGSAQKADIGFPVATFAWGMVDAAARLLAGQEPSTVGFGKAAQVLTKESIDFDPETTATWTVPNYEASFKASWGKD